MLKANSLIDDLLKKFDNDSNSKHKIESGSKCITIQQLIVEGYIRRISNKKNIISGLIPFDIINLTYLFYHIVCNQYLYHIISTEESSETIIKSIDLFSENNKYKKYLFKIHNITTNNIDKMLTAKITSSNDDGLYLISNYKFPQNIINYASQKYNNTAKLLQNTFKNNESYSAMFKIGGPRWGGNVEKNIKTDILIFKQPSNLNHQQYIDAYWFDLPIFPAFNDYDDDDEDSDESDDSDEDNTPFISSPTMVQYKNSLLVVGYLSNYHENNTIYSLNMETLQWSNISKNIIDYAKLPIKYSSSLLIKDDTLFIMGGRRKGDDDTEFRWDGCRDKNVEMINLKNKTISKLRAMNHLRCHEGCCFIDNFNKIVIGGNTEDDPDWNKEKTSIIEFYDMNKNIWYDYKYKTNKSHSDSVVWCGDKFGNQSVIYIAGNDPVGRPLSNDETGYIEWCDIRENNQWRIWNEKSIIQLFDYTIYEDWKKNDSSQGLLV